MTKYITILLLLTSLAYSLSIEDYLEIAEKNNPSLRSAFYKYKSHVQHENASGYLPDPVIGVGYSISPIETRLGAQSGKIAIKQSLPWSVLTDDEENIAKYSVNSSMSDYKDVREKVFFQIKKVYYKIYSNTKEIQYTEKILKNYVSLSSIKDQNISVSKTSLTSNIMFENKYDTMKEKLIQLKSDLEHLNYKFNLLLNRDTDMIVEIPDSLTIPPIIPNDQANGKLSNNSLESISYLIQKKNYEIKSAERKRFPTFSIGMDYVFIDERTDMIVDDNGKDAFIASVSMNLPINFRKTGSVIKKKTLEKKALEYKKFSEEKSLLTNINRTKKNIDDLIRKLKLKVKIIKRYESIIEIEQQNLETDGSSIEKLIKFINDKYSNLIQSEKLRSELSIAYAYLDLISTTTYDSVKKQNNHAEEINHENN
jgi:cobalt-zinc-cadmium efflux system outer membrane protein